MLPTGIEIMVGVINAIPGKPYELIILTSIRLRLVNLFGGTLALDLNESLILIADHSFINPRSKKRKATTPQHPETVENRNMGRKPHFVATYNAGTPTTNLTMQSKKIGTSLTIAACSEFFAVSQVAGIAQTRHDVGFSR